MHTVLAKYRNLKRRIWQHSPRAVIVMSPSEARSGMSKAQRRQFLTDEERFVLDKHEPEMKMARSLCNLNEIHRRGELLEEKLQKQERDGRQPMRRSMGFR